MKPLADWEESDLQALIDNQVQESLQLDYKRSDSLAKTSTSQTELAKDVSAFANSAGGRIIYGIMEADNLPVSIDGGSDPTVITREWIENTIIGKIQPRMHGVTIKPILLAAGGIAYVIDIPQATTFAPHQAGHRYYRRHNFSSVPMEDYEVKDAMRRASVGDPYVRLHWSPRRDVGEPSGVLRAHLGNHASEPIMYALLTLIIDARFVPEDFIFSDWEVRRDLVAMMDGWPNVPVCVFTRKIMPTSHMPIFKEQEWLVLEIANPIQPVNRFHFGYEITGPGFSKSQGGRYIVDGFGVTPLIEGTGELFHTDNLPPASWASGTSA